MLVSGDPQWTREKNEQAERSKGEQRPLVLCPLCREQVPSFRDVICNHAPGPAPSKDEPYPPWCEGSGTRVSVPMERVRPVPVSPDPKWKYTRSLGHVLTSEDTGPSFSSAFHDHPHYWTSSSYLHIKIPRRPADDPDVWADFVKKQLLPVLDGDEALAEHMAYRMLFCQEWYESYNFTNEE